MRIMEVWKSHVRAALFKRDCLQKDQFSGLFSQVSRLEETLSLHLSLWEDLERDNRHSPTTNGIRQCPAESKTSPKLYLKLKEDEKLRQKLAQEVSDLTSTMYLKEAELQYCHFQVTRYRNEALHLAREASSLKNDLIDYEYKLECQAKELTVLRLEQRTLREQLETARREKDELLERWLEEKREEAERLNKHNATLERWNRYAGQVSKRRRTRPRWQKCAVMNGQIIQRESDDHSSTKHE